MQTTVIDLVADSQYGVTVMSADQLAGLCRQHSKTPLGLDDYRSLFVKGGSLEMQAVDERADEVKRIITLAAAMCEAIRDRSTVFGRLSARDLPLILSDKSVAEGTTEEELQALLDTRGQIPLRRRQYLGQRAQGGTEGVAGWGGVADDDCLGTGLGKAVPVVSQRVEDDRVPGRAGQDLLFGRVLAGEVDEGVQPGGDAR